jgi:anti-sigma regulatory factor (Ser/Thr protein kinase)
MRTVKEQFNRKIDSMEKLIPFIEDFMTPLRVHGEVCSLMVFVAEELFTNMVKYNPTGPAHVTVILIEDGSKLSIVMEDKTKQPFDLTKLKPVDVDLPLEKRRPGGLGIHLMKTMMDEVRYTFENGTSRTTVVKYLEDKYV